VSYTVGKCDTVGVSAPFTESSGGSQTASSLSGTFGPSSTQITSNLSTQSTPGILHAGVSSSVNISGTAAIAVGYADTGFEDALVINIPQLLGQTGYLFVGFTVDANISSSGVGKSSAMLQASVGPNLEQFSFLNLSNGSYFVLFPAFSFTYGQSFGLLVLLDTTAGTPDQSLVTGSGVAIADISDTVVLSSIVVEDQFGNVVSGATISSATGTNYTSNGVIPEPGTFFLALSGVGLIVTFRARGWADGYFIQGRQKRLRLHEKGRKLEKETFVLQP
jgi:hypothetical protein